MELTAPAPDEIEVSIVGRGYGETVIVHMGWGDWLVVDSCTDHAAPPAPYAAIYLNELSVDFGRIRWVVASHWHDDHVAGLSALVKLCPNADVFMSEALRSQEFVSLALLDVEEPPGSISSGLREMRATLDVLRASKRTVRQARAEQRLHADEQAGVAREIWSLSPSNAASLKSKQSFVTEMLPIAAGRRRVAAPEPNETSVALHVRVGPVVALLGADLENETSDDRGWKAVLGSSGRPREQASLFKVAHHGALNGDHPDVWAEMLEPQPVAALTPYATGRRPRPDDADVARICGHTPHAYVAGPRHVKLDRASSPVEKIRRRATRSAVVCDRPLGHVRTRRRLADAGWTIELRGAAQQLCRDATFRSKT